MEFFTADSVFITQDKRQKRWAIPYNHEALNARSEILLANNAQYLQNKKILDLGCHFGTFSYLCLQLGAKHVTGIDSDAQLISQAQSFFHQEKVHPSKYNFIQTEVTNFLTNLPADSYDTILCFGLLYYLPDNFNILSLMKKIAKTCIVLDTFTGYYAALQGKDGPQIFKTLTPKSHQLPLLLHSLTKAEKQKNYKLPTNTFKTQPNEKPLTLLTCPTIPLLELYFKTLGLKAKKLSWSKYLKNPNLNWTWLESPENKINSHWSDIYATDIRVSYLLQVTP